MNELPAAAEQEPSAQQLAAVQQLRERFRAFRARRNRIYLGMLMGMAACLLAGWLLPWAGARLGAFIGVSLVFIGGQVLLLLNSRSFAQAAREARKVIDGY